MFNLKKSSLAVIAGFILLSMFFGFLGGVITNEYVFPFLVQKMDQNKKEDDLIVRKEIKETSYIEESAIIDSVEKVSPSVVSIVISKEFTQMKNQGFLFDPFFNDPFFREFYGLPQDESDNSQNNKTEKMTVGGGTGFIFTANGLILTNKHVVSDQDAEYTVILANGDEYQAEVSGLDTLNDIAVLKLIPKEGEKIEGLPVVEFGDSQKIQVGQRVVAIGYALGEYQNTVTTGVISAKDRQISAMDGLAGKLEALSNLIQTDAAINPGNSGGPLVNLKGQVIAINTAIASGASGIGFAIPINDAKVVIDSIMQYGRIVRPVLGVRYQMLDEKTAKMLNLNIKNGALLVGDQTKGEFAVIPDSPAARADLRVEDVIISIDGENLTLERDLRSIVSEHKIGDKLKLEVWRKGQILKKEVELEEAGEKESIKN